jgi:hypothetical protein
MAGIRTGQPPTPRFGTPQGIAKTIGIQQYNDALQATARFYASTGEPIAGNLFLTQTRMENGAYRTQVFVSSRYKVPRALLNTYEDLGVQVWQLRGVSQEAGHSEMAAGEYRKIMGSLPADERITSVEDALSLRPICGTACAENATSFVGRSGVTLEPDSNGYTSAPQVADRIASERASGVSEPEPMLQAIAGAYQEYLGLMLGLEGER